MDKENNGFSAVVFRRVFSGFFTRCAQFFDLLQLLVSGYQRTQTELVFHKHEVFKYLSKRLLDILGEVRLSPLD